MARFDRAQIFRGGLGDFLQGYRQAESDAFESERNKRQIRDSDFAFGQKFRREGLEGERLRLELDQASANLRRTELQNLNQALANRFESSTLDSRVSRERSTADAALLGNAFESRTLDDRVSRASSQASIASTQASLEGDRIRAGIASRQAQTRNFNRLANQRTGLGGVAFGQGASSFGTARRNNTGAQELNTRPAINTQNEVNFVAGQIDRLLSQGDKNGASRLAQTLRGTHLDDNEYNRLVGAIDNFQSTSNQAAAFGPFQQGVPRGSFQFNRVER